MAIAKEEGGVIPAFDTESPPGWYFEVVNGRRRIDSLSEDELERLRHVMQRSTRCYVNPQLVGTKLEDAKDEPLILNELPERCTLQAFDGEGTPIFIKR